MSDQRMHDSESCERSGSPSAKINIQHDGDQSNTVNDHGKNSQSLEARRPLPECLQAQGQHVPRAHAPQYKARFSSVSNKDTVIYAAGKPVSHMYVSPLHSFMSLTFFSLSELPWKVMSPPRLLRLHLKQQKGKTLPYFRLKLLTHVL